MGLLSQGFALVRTGLILYRYQTGNPLNGPLITNVFHGLEAMAALLLIAGLAALVLAAGIVILPAGAVLIGLTTTELAIGGALMSASGLALLNYSTATHPSQPGLSTNQIRIPLPGAPLPLEVATAAAATIAGTQALPLIQDLVDQQAGSLVLATDGRAVGGTWEDGPKPPPPLDTELDDIVEHAWDKHVVDGPDFPDVQAEEDLRELLEDVIENATEWGYREDGAVYWYDDVTDTVVIKNPPGIGGTTYRPDAGD